ncbi:MAG: hypothetical protein LQ341_003962 [Variospora aurantia]|nr:MAG: hypothetical protein LQ341_003962 [Variospora aurantia]
MGNASTKEQRAEARRPRQLDHRSLSSPLSSGPNSPANPSAESSSQHIYSSRAGRRSRPDLSTLFGLGSHSGDNADSVDTRRETKQEKEARKMERERVARLKERERSMREEHVDGGYLVTQGVYTGIEDFDKATVRQLMVERRLAPFWRGLNDWSESWTENQLIAAARGLPVPAPDEIPQEQETGPFSRNNRQLASRSNGNDSSLTVPITSRSPSYASDSSNIIPGLSQQLPPSDISQSAPSSGIFRGRAKTLASLTTTSKHPSEAIIPAERQLPQDPYINGQRIEVFLYKDTFECPICLIYYPVFGNKTRCCDQWICSECFVQIKRPNPHPPEHVDPSLPPPLPAESEEPGEEGELVSEPAMCPFCKQAEFGITYEPPPFRRGLAYVNQLSSQQIGKSRSAMSSSTSLSSGLSGGQLSPTTGSRRRAVSLSATDGLVITTDKIRPDWHHKLMSARAHASRRSAAATALHTAAYMMGDRGDGDGRSLGAFSRRGLLRRGSGPGFPSSGNASAQASMMALLQERHAAGTLTRIDGHDWTPMGPGSIAPPRGSSQRSRIDDLEEMMMMEAIQLSLASEEERRKTSEKVLKKERKKQEKEAKKEWKAALKAEKAAAKMWGDYHESNNSTTGFSSRSETSLPAARSPSEHESRYPEGSDESRLAAAESLLAFAEQSPIAEPSRIEEQRRIAEQASEQERFAADVSALSAHGSAGSRGKGEAVRRSGQSSSSEMEASPWGGRMPPRSDSDRGLPSHPFVWDSQRNPQGHLERARAQLGPDLQRSNGWNTYNYKPSHLRTTSNISSSSSSMNESLPGSSRDLPHGSNSSFEASPDASSVNIGSASSSSAGFASGVAPGGGAGLEPMLGFQSLAEMIGKDKGSNIPPLGPTTEPEVGSSHDSGELPNYTFGETERSNSVATVQPNEEFHETSEYPKNRSNRSSLNPQMSRKPGEGERLDHIT